MQWCREEDRFSGARYACLPQAGLPTAGREERMNGIPMKTSNSPVLSYEILRSFEKRSQRSFSISSLSCMFQTQTPFSIDSTYLKTFVGSQSSSIVSSLSNSFVSLLPACQQITGHIGTDKILSFPLFHYTFYPSMTVFIPNDIPDVGGPVAQINPSTFPGLNPGVCSGLILCGTLNPLLKNGVWRHRSINLSKKSKLFLTSPHLSLYRSFQPSLSISSQSLGEGLFFSPSLLKDHLQC
mgnify:CR=1 FL=1